MEIQQEIIQFAKDHKKFSTQDIVLRYNQKFTRQYVSKILTMLVTQGKLVKIGSTKLSYYALPENADELGSTLVLRLKNKLLEEDRIFEQVKSKFSPLTQLPENASRIFYYAFSEILNNAIEHSRSETIEIKIIKEKDDIVFEIRDFGIGVFLNIQKERRLKSELEAIQDLLKGKQTTAPKAHSGEGIFFTSKIADVFLLESFDFGLKIDNTINDIFVVELKRSVKGTRAIFKMKTDSKKSLKTLFEKYQTESETFAFDKTEIKVKLYTLGEIFISRSQAKRILHGLEKFKLVILDFEKVSTVGQAFADEIFRVFKKSHPKIEVKPINMNSAVDFIIERAIRTKR